MHVAYPMFMPPLMGHIFHFPKSQISMLLQYLQIIITNWKTTTIVLQTICDDGCGLLVYSFSLCLSSSSVALLLSTLQISHFLLPWYDCRCCCPIHGILRGQLITLQNLDWNSSCGGCKNPLMSLISSLVKLVHQHFGFTKESDWKEKKFKRISNFTVDDVTVLLCFEASCCSSVSWETMSQFLFTFEASRCTSGIEWSSQEANESWKKMLYIVNCNCLLWALSFTEVVAFQATRGHYAYDLY
jgi:hypothetical protein